MTEFALFRIKYYLMEKSIEHRDQPDLRNWYQAGLMVVSAKSIAIDEYNQKRWKRLKG
jgi:hypothetical protein